MSRSLDLLVPEMKVKAENVKQKCLDQGVEILIYYTLRDLQEQAILFRSSFKDYVVVAAKMAKLEKMGYNYLVDILKDVGAQKYTKWTTSAACGESWHNYGMAIDSVPKKNNKLLWDYSSNKKEWNIYGEACISEGLTWGGKWNRKDYPHAQLRPENNPLKVYSPEEIKKMLKL